VEEKGRGRQCLLISLHPSRKADLLCRIRTSRTTKLLAAGRRLPLGAVNYWMKTDVRMTSSLGILCRVAK